MYISSLYKYVFSSFYSLYLVYSVDLDVFIEIGLVNSYSESQSDSKCGANTDLLLNVLLQLPQGDIDLLKTLTPKILPSPLGNGTFHFSQNWPFHFGPNEITNPWTQIRNVPPAHPEIPISHLSTINGQAFNILVLVGGGWLYTYSNENLS